MLGSVPVNEILFTKQNVKHLLNLYHARYHAIIYKQIFMNEFILHYSIVEEDMSSLYTTDVFGIFYY